MMSTKKLVSFLVFYCCLLFHLQATTYYVSSSGSDNNDGLSTATAWKSLEHASKQIPEGEHTIRLSEGIFVINQTILLKSGWTITGQGHAQTTTTLINAASFTPLGDVCQTEKNAPKQNYLLGGDNLQDITLSNLVLASREEQPLDGALIFRWGKRIELHNLLVRNFRWNGIYVYNSREFNIHHCNFENASYQKNCGYWSGGLRTRYVKDFALHHCEFKTTEGGGYGYKASGHENAKIHDNIFHNNTSLKENDGRPFDLESAHEFEWGLEIYHNVFNGMVSVPRAGQQAHPSDRGDYTYTVRIHDNVFYGSGGVEGPRSYLEIDHNYFAQKWGNSGRVYEIHGGENAGPTTIHHNVAECSMGFVFKKGEMNENISILHNTVYLVNSDRHNFPTSFLEVSGEVKNWQVKNNVIFSVDAQAPDKSSVFSRGSLPETGLDISHNIAWKIKGAGKGSTEAEPGLSLSGPKPEAYYRPKIRSSAVVDQGTEVGFPFEGTAPDIGAYERQSAPPAATPGDTTVVTSIDREVITETDGFSIFPNPAAYHLTIVRQGPPFSVELVNALGLTVLPRTSSVGDKLQLDLSSYAPGVYFIKIHHTQGTTSQRIVKQ